MQLPSLKQAGAIYLAALALGGIGLYFHLSSQERSAGGDDDEIGPEPIASPMSSSGPICSPMSSPLGQACEAAVEKEEAMAKEKFAL
jgi:hypothetical protein